MPFLRTHIDYARFDLSPTSFDIWIRRIYNFQVFSTFFKNLGWVLNPPMARKIGHEIAIKRREKMPFDRSPFDLHVS